MLRLMYQALLRGARKRTAKTTSNRSFRFTPSVHSLESREMPAVLATYVLGTLTVFGDNQDNTIAISRDAAGDILVNGGAVKVIGGRPTVANTSIVSVFGLGGNDTITMDETNGALPQANLFGGAGNDVLTGGSGADLLFGEAGNDTLLGKGGNDLLFGGDGDDTLTGGVGDDQVFGEAGNDRMIWNPGEGTDLNEGGAGTDTVEVNGGNGAEQFTVAANGSRVRFDRVSPAPFSLDIGTSENLVVNMNGGDDTFTAGNGLASLIQIAVDGGAGNDTITGSDGNDRLSGGDGNDTIIGGRGSDAMFGGAGDDTFVWNPGDGSDTIEGQDGNDTMQFNGANVNENFNLSANGSRLRFTRDVGNITMDTNGLEQVNLNALGGADAITMGDLSGTGLRAFNIDLGAADGQADSVVLNGSNYSENITIQGTGTSATVSGLPTFVSIANIEAADALRVNANGGNDNISASGFSTPVSMTLDGGSGNDTITGGRGNDVLLGGAGDDVFNWNPGDGSDTIEGQDGTDKLFFFGANVNENINISANGNRVRFSRDVGNVTMDMAGTEKIEFRALGGADNIMIGDLTGTDMTNIELALRGPNGGTDGAADTVTVNGTQGNDTIGVNGDIGGLRVSGLKAEVAIFDADPTLDTLTVNGLGGNDTINAQSLRADAVLLTLNGGDGDDTITGSDGNDVINGGRGNDVAFMGNGDDQFVWNPGDGSDTVEGQGGRDEMVFNGANVNENVNISANGSRLRFTRDVGNITMDTNGLEVVTFNALGGADNITVGDLTGTDVTDVNLNIASTIGGTAGDGAADTVIVDGTNGDDAIVAVGDANGVSVFGLAATVNITGAEAANDRLVVNALAGDDVVEASSLLVGSIQLTADGGAGNDVLIGGDGNDTLLGGDGDDELIGGLGQDILDGGTGDNVLIQ
jgi:Ca2+-binding RTX toxin-like protein